MFASLSSFLPSALLQVSPGARPPDALPPSPTVPPDPPAPDPPRKKEKKEKHASEAFIIVRPPPSMSAQPLSLQVQLVPPQSRNDRPVQALDASPDEFGTDLRRTHSNGSEASTYSGFASAGSISSFASTSTAGSGRRMIIPLYNLNVHSVMPTTILDAGTDAKVAKFAKRGLEVVGLAFLEPIEVRHSPPAPGALAVSTGARASLDGPLREFGSPSTTLPSRRPASPVRLVSAHATVNPSSNHPRSPIVSSIPIPQLLPPDVQSAQRSTKKLFTKMFKKKGAASQLSIAVPSSDETIPFHPSFPNSARLSEEASVTRPETPHHYDSRSYAPFASTTTSQTAVLGIHPTLYPSVSNPRGRPIKYIWVVRRWLKGSDTRVLNGMMGKLSVSARGASVPQSPPIEVRFEWCREQKKRVGRKSRADKGPEEPSNMAPQTTLRPDGLDHRSSVVSHNSSCSDTATSLTSSAHRHGEESDEESDPEDSETPWTCIVTVQRLGPAPRYQDGPQEPVVRLKVATLAPTPHHPKVVAMLKMPFPLPDVEVERLLVRRRLVTAQGISKTTVPNASELVLTAEEMKDTISSTALWLVVRESFGGLGRERKKVKS